MPSMHLQLSAATSLSLVTTLSHLRSTTPEIVAPSLCSETQPEE
jgi:hypothetical protein